MFTQNDENQDVVRWAPNGIGFIVLNEDIFSKDVLPRYFKHSNYSSFVRQVKSRSLSSTCITFIRFERTILRVISIINALTGRMRINSVKSRENLKKRKEKIRKPMKMVKAKMRKNLLWDINVKKEWNRRSKWFILQERMKHKKRSNHKKIRITSFPLNAMSKRKLITQIGSLWG